MMKVTRQQLLFSILGILLAIIFAFFGTINFLSAVAALVIIYLCNKDEKNGFMIFIFLIPFLSDVTLLLIAIIVGGFNILKYIKQSHIVEQSIPFTNILMIFCIMMIATTLFSINLVPSLKEGSMRDFILHSIAIFVIITVLYNKHTNKDLHKYNLALILAAVLSSIYGFYQFIVGVPMESGWVDPASNLGITTRIFATFENPNIFSLFLVLILPSTLSMIYSTKDKKRKIVFGFFGILMVIALILTLSRGGWIASAIGIIIFIALTNIRNVVNLIILGILSLPLLPNVVLGRLLSIGNITDSSNAYRIGLWRTAGNIIKDYWPLGTGFGYQSFTYISKDYFYGKAPYHLHNTFIQFFVENGIVGIITLLALLILIFKIGLTTVCESKNKYNKNMSAALIAGFISLMVQGMFEHVLYHPKIIFYFWIVICLIILNYKHNYSVRGNI